TLVPTEVGAGRNADEVIQVAVTIKQRDKPVGFATTDRRLIRKLRRKGRLSIDADALVSLRQTHVRVRTPQFINELIRCLLQSDSSVPIVVRLECLNHHSPR